MQNLISAKKAREITGGRTPLVPVQYETAIKALTECIHLDDAKVWADKADALAAWAKIYRSKDAELKAKQLKLHAFRRMGQIAEELRPTRRAGRNSLGAASLLIESGLQKHVAATVVRIARAPESQFTAAVIAGAGVNALALSQRGRMGTAAATDSMDWLMNGISGPRLRSVLSKMKAQPAASIAEGLTGDEVISALECITEVADWLDQLAQILEKRKRLFGRKQ